MYTINSNHYYLARRTRLRYSRQREIILNNLKGRKDHPTADEIYTSCRVVEPNISLGTVYRNLKQLAEEGEIITLETTDNKIHYDGDVSSHSHFECEKCGKIIDIFRPMRVPKELKDMGLTVKSEKCVYYGLCTECIIKN